MNNKIKKNLKLSHEKKKHTGENTASSTNGAGKKWISICTRLKLGPYFSPHIKIISKWIKNLKSETLKLMQENIRETPQDLSIGTEFLNRTRTAQEIVRISKWDCMKLKSFCM
jgi:hypothetical protein